MKTTIFDTLIQTWNPHFSNSDDEKWEHSIPRKHYMSLLKTYLDLRHVLILTGIRRAGKSTLMHQLMQYLLQEKNIPPYNVLYLFLEDVSILPYMQNGIQFLDELFSFYLETYNPKGMLYVFLDEIQSVPDFNRWVATRYEKHPRVKFILSGSRYSLVQSDTASLLTGRNILLQIEPFSFAEYLAVHKVSCREGEDASSVWRLNVANQSVFLHYLSAYMKEGGFPEIVLANNDVQKRVLASNYFRDCITRDILLPNHVRNEHLIELLAFHLLQEFTKTHTYSSLGKPYKLSAETVKNYLMYFEKAFLFYQNQSFSYKTKETQDIQKPKKIYAADNGLRNLNIPYIRPDLGQCAENICSLEFRRQMLQQYYWKRKHEVDFVVFRPSISLYNVSYTDVIHPREIDSLVEAMEHFSLEESTLLTKSLHGTETVQGKRIHCIPVWAWLLAHQ